jgi:hypothetical protein
MELSSGGVLVEVRDDGVGVSPTRLADMNWRLDHPPVIDVSISRHMGLYAVSRLAARHGIRVKLRPGAPAGLSALVWLPGTLAKREPTPAPGSHTRASGVNAATPVAGIRPGVPNRYVTGRHRSRLATSGGQPLMAGQAGGQAGRSTTAWFAAKRPSSGAAVPAEELATSWQPATNGSATADGSAAQEPAERTASGLPRRVPRTSTRPGWDTPDSGMAAAADPEVPVLDAPSSGNASPGAPPQEAPHQGHPASRRHSPDAARSRLSGFQLGSRDAVQAGHGTGWTPFAEEENSR